MYRYLRILFSPLLKRLQHNARARNCADKILRRFPGIKPYLVKLLYGHSAHATHVRILHTGPRQQRIYEELKRRLEAPLK